MLSGQKGLMKKWGNMKMAWNFSEAAISFISDLAPDQEQMTIIEFLVQNPGQSSATLSVNFGEVIDQEKHYSYKITDNLTAVTDKVNLEALTDLTIEFSSDSSGGGELEIKAPKLYGDTTQWTLVEKLNQFMASEIAPYLQSHNGNAKVVDINGKNEAIIEFSGGCQGCSMAQVTLKSGIEKKIKDKFPQITNVVDYTDHQKGTNPYYSGLED